MAEIFKKDAKRWVLVQEVPTKEGHVGDHYQTIFLSDEQFAEFMRGKNRLIEGEIYEIYELGKKTVWSAGGVEIL
jgi:hypothetical protein